MKLGIFKLMVTDPIQSATEVGDRLQLQKLNPNPNPQKFGAMW